MKYLAMIYSITSYLIGVVTLVYLILFTGDMVVSWTVNVAAPTAPEFSGIIAVLWNLLLVGLWGLQHSIWADPGFKKLWTKIVPAAIERSTYLLFVTLMTAIIVAFWAPMPAIIWNVSGDWLGRVLLFGFYFGWSVVLSSTFLINHFHLFGLSQAFQMLRKTESKEASFVTPLFYKIVRHPMMTGVLIALWCAPTLTVGRLVFNFAMTFYVFLGIRHEEKTLVADLGEEYEKYQKIVPAVIPFTTPR